MIISIVVHSLSQEWSCWLFLPQLCIIWGNIVISYPLWDTVDIPLFVWFPCICANFGHFCCVINILQVYVVSTQSPPGSPSQDNRARFGSLSCPPTQTKIPLRRSLTTTSFNRNIEPPIPVSLPSSPMQQQQQHDMSVSSSSSFTSSTSSVDQVCFLFVCLFSAVCLFDLFVCCMRFCWTCRLGEVDPMMERRVPLYPQAAVEWLYVRQETLTTRNRATRDPLVV